MLVKILIFIAGLVVGELFTFGMIALCKSASDSDDNQEN